jgi:hypothetical protein
VIGTQDATSNSKFAAILTAVYVPFVVCLAWMLGGKQLRRWWRRRKLNIPEREENVRTINGPLREVGWIKVSEVGEKYPEEQRSTVLGNDLPQVVRVLKAKFGDDFEEKNFRRASKQSYSDVIVGIPGT